MDPLSSYLFIQLNQYKDVEEEEEKEDTQMMFFLFVWWTINKLAHILNGLMDVCVCVCIRKQMIFGANFRC